MTKQSHSPTVLSFEEAIATSDSLSGERHVLLGNGFSIACRPDRFAYDALFNLAAFADASTDIRLVFDHLETTDFEKVIASLQLAAGLTDVYETSDTALPGRFRVDAEVVREALAQVLASRHPDLPSDISEKEYRSARKFLGNFHRVYTLNYDMLLYWTMMQELEPPIPRNDGFGNPDDEDADYVVWDPYAVYGTQRVFFLHGSLHLYDRGSELTKITWSRTAIPLVDQIRRALSEGSYPLIVTEGSSVEKTEKILHHAYLTHAIRSFSRIRGSLFLYGLSLTPNDEHLLRRIAEGNVHTIFVSVFGGINSDGNSRLTQRALALQDERAARNPRKPLTVHFFEAGSADVWR